MAATSLYKADATSFLDTCAATTNATSVTAAATEVFSISAYNAAASVRFVKFYNKATAPTVGTDTPVFVLAIPASGWATMTWAKGLYLSTGLGYGIVTGAANANTTAPTANDVVSLSITYSIS
jgi:hypothetical protein